MTEANYMNMMFTEVKDDRSEQRDYLPETHKCQDMEHLEIVFVPFSILFSTIVKWLFLGKFIYIADRKFINIKQMDYSGMCVCNG